MAHSRASISQRKGLLLGAKGRGTVSLSTNLQAPKLLQLYLIRPTGGSADSSSRRAATQDEILRKTGPRQIGILLTANRLDMKVHMF